MKTRILSQVLVCVVSLHLGLPVMAAEGKLIVQGAKGELLVAEARPDACRVVSKAQVLGGRCWTTPVLCHGRLYARNARGDLVCLDVRRP